jgi:hypothetical protein
MIDDIEDNKINDDDDVYSGIELENMMDNDEIDPIEEGFMQGYNLS